MTLHHPVPETSKSTASAERYTLIAAGAVIAALTAAAFWLSYAHLAEVAGKHGLAKSPERQWAWPGTLDAFIVVGELLMLRAGLRKVTDWWAVALTGIGSVGSIVLNVAGVSGTGSGPVPLLDYVVAAVPPTAALLAFGVLMRQIHQHVAEPSSSGHRIPPTAVTGADGAYSGDRPPSDTRTDGKASVPVTGSLPTGDRQNGDAAGAIPEYSHGPRLVPEPQVPTESWAETGPGTAKGTVRDRGTDKGTVPNPGTDKGTVPNPGTDKGTVPNPGTAHGARSAGLSRARSGDRPRHDRTPLPPAIGDRQPTGTGTEAEGPRPHPVPDEDQDGHGDGDRGADETDEPPAGRQQQPAPTKRPAARPRDRSRTGRGPGTRAGRSDDELVDLLRPHVRTALDRDGNESVTRVQLREIMRAQKVSIRNDRLTGVLARLRADTMTKRSPTR
ncbi:DUF2637 domain-containing protein [Streptomyces sp. NPDC093225]|uniref:DUF2637 domain-containing protein n=1 Tax=Streptomyces sp. NPDC093225 TaxID=3366034 RepID=UPI0037F413D4